jgi:hypothetical protein
LGGAIGSALPIPGGQIIGSVIGSIVGGLFKKTPKGLTTITDAGATVSGSRKLREGLTGQGNNVSDTIARIAEALGGSVGSFSVGIKQKGKKFTVGGQSFSTAEEATRAAILAAIDQGAVVGIRQGAQRILRAGTDIEKAIDKAAKFQSIFDRLREYEDPAGAALERLNREFESLRKIATEAGEGLVELERLYGFERAKVVEEMTQRLTGSLQQLIDDLKTGENGLSLRDRQANALAQYNPLAESIRQGKTVDYDKFAEVARNLLDINRQIYGSQGGYFSSFNDIINLSELAISRERASLEGATGSNASPFTSSTPSSDGSAPVVGAINTQTGELLAVLNAVNDNIINLRFAGGGGAIGGSNIALLSF